MRLTPAVFPTKISRPLPDLTVPWSWLPNRVRASPYASLDATQQSLQPDVALLSVEDAGIVRIRSAAALT
jgi:hypothetical protein